MNLPPGRVTNIIAVILIAIHAALVFGGWHQWAVMEAGLVPARLLGEMPAGLVPPLLTPFTAFLLHGDWLHLGMNILMLLFTGRHVERALGAGFMILMLIAGAIFAAGAEVFFSSMPDVVVIGASGAISALVAGYALLWGNQSAPRIGPFSPLVVRTVWLAAAWIGINYLFGIAMSASGQPIALWSHIGGFVAGLLLARPLLALRYRGA